ncbi:MAG: hypothetical protein ACJ8FO_04980 [Sphingomicrobium sp.]
MTAPAPQDCACSACKKACETVPGWFTPAEAVRAIEAGLARRMSAVSEILSGMFALAPSVAGREGRAGWHGLGRCTLLTADGRCEIHDSGFKPVECRTGYGCHDGPDLPKVEEMWAMWRSPEGKAAVELWQSRVSAGAELARAVAS